MWAGREDQTLCRATWGATFQIKGAALDEDLKWWTPSCERGIHEKQCKRWVCTVYAAKVEAILVRIFLQRLFPFPGFGRDYEGGAKSAGQRDTPCCRKDAVGIKTSSFIFAIFQRSTILLSHAGCMLSRVPDNPEGSLCRESPHELTTLKGLNSEGKAFVPRRTCV